jgi:peptidoglycan/xylan/chitin deacetylase (PgdA/CDA1 family)
MFGSKSVCITFDDGYTDNFTNASKLLEKFRLPASFFISSGYIGKQEPYWWDELESIILRSEQLPSNLCLYLGDQRFTFDNTNGETLTATDREQITSWKAKNKTSNKRCNLYLQLWNFIMPLTSSDRQVILAQVREWAGSNSRDIVATDMLPMDEKQLNSLAANSLFSIGLHTTHHIALDKQEIAIQEEEIITNQQALERAIGRQVNILSFPYGRFDERTRQVVSRANIASAFTSEKRVVSKHTDRYQIGRFAVGNWEGEELNRKLQTWFATA